MYHVTLIPGDGSGPETVHAARRCIEATGVPITWEMCSIGQDSFAATGQLVPTKTIESIRRTQVALKGPVVTPPGVGLRSVNVHLRQEFDLYACIRPCKLYPGVRSVFQGRPVDLVIIRENTEDLYTGIEFEMGKADTRQMIQSLNSRSGKQIRSDSGLSIKAISETGSRRIVQFAFEYARRMNRRSLIAVHKANIMRLTDGVFLNAARSIAKEYSDINFEDRIIDNLCLSLVQEPEQFDMLVMPNLYGDIISDLAVGIVGGLGVVPSANMGDQGAIFETIHGSAVKLKAQNRVNPTAMILSGAWMLRYLGRKMLAIG